MKMKNNIEIISGEEAEEITIDYFLTRCGTYLTNIKIIIDGASQNIQLQTNNRPKILIEQKIRKESD